MKICKLIMNLDLVYSISTVPPELLAPEIKMILEKPKRKEKRFLFLHK